MRNEEVAKMLEHDADERRSAVVAGLRALADGIEDGSLEFHEIKYRLHHEDVPEGPIIRKVASGLVTYELLVKHPVGDGVVGPIGDDE